MHKFDMFSYLVNRFFSNLALLMISSYNSLGCHCRHDTVYHICVKSATSKLQMGNCFPSSSNSAVCKSKIYKICLYFTFAFVLLLNGSSDIAVLFCVTGFLLIGSTHIMCCV